MLINNLSATQGDAPHHPHGLDFKRAASRLDCGVMNRKSECRDTAAKTANRKLYHANPIIVVTDPQTSTTTH